MIVDCHTHIFPPEVATARERYLAADATFAELYASPRASLASVEDLLSSMDAAGIDVSVALGFAWRDAETCRSHNDYLLASAASSRGRIVAFCTLPLAAGFDAIAQEARRCLAAGARGFGELRPENLGFDLTGEDGKALGRLARELDTTLLFHASEPVGHIYPGKQGLALSPLYGFLLEHPELRTIAAHWGGGLPFYALMPEVKLALRHASFDSAGTSLLYSPDVYRVVSELTSPQQVLFGSDYPLLSQKRSRQRIEESGLDAATRGLVLGGNAARILGLD